MKFNWTWPWDKSGMGLWVGIVWLYSPEWNATVFTVSFGVGAANFLFPRA